MWPRCSAAGGGGGGGGDSGGGGRGGGCGSGGGSTGGLVGGSGGSRTALWIPYCAQPDRRTPGELVDFSGKAECLKLIREVNRETSSYRHLAVGLGGSGDCEQLRDELKRSRRRAHDLARQAKAKLLPCILDPRLGPGEKREAERLCRLLFYCIRVLEQELLRTLSLQRNFALHLGPLSLINTGVNEFGNAHRSAPNPAPSPEDLDVSLADRLTLERVELARMQKEIIELHSVIDGLEGYVDVQAWLQDETSCEELLTSLQQQDEEEEDEDDDDDDDASQRSNNESALSNMEPLQPATGGSSGIRQRVRQRQCLSWVLASVGTTLLVATTLGILIVVFS